MLFGVVLGWMKYWGDVELWGFRSRENFSDFKGLVMWILKNCKSSELFTIQARSIWNQKYQIRLNQVCYPTDI